MWDSTPRLTVCRLYLLYVVMNSSLFEGLLLILKMYVRFLHVFGILCISGKSFMAFIIDVAFGKDFIPNRAWISVFSYPITEIAS